MVTGAPRFQSVSARSNRSDRSRAGKMRTDWRLLTTQTVASRPVGRELREAIAAAARRTRTDDHHVEFHTARVAQCGGYGARFCAIGEGTPIEIDLFKRSRNIRSWLSYLAMNPCLSWGGSVERAPTSVIEQPAKPLPACQACGGQTRTRRGARARRRPLKKQRSRRRAGAVSYDRTPARALSGAVLHHSCELKTRCRTSTAASSSARHQHGLCGRGRKGASC